MTALATALAFGFALAFAGWVLWLRERRGEMVSDQIRRLLDLTAMHTAKLHIHADALQSLSDLRGTVNDMALKAGLRPRG